MKFKTGNPPEDSRYLILAKIRFVGESYTREYYSILRYSDDAGLYVDITNADNRYDAEDIIGYCVIEKSRGYK